MTPIAILDLIAGLIFIYFLLSIVNNSLFEIFISISKFRAFMLKKWLLQTFTSAELSANDIMNHPLVSGLSANNKAPSYMGGKAFASVISDILLRAARTKGSATSALTQGLAELEAEIKASSINAVVKDMLLTFCNRTKLEKAITPTLNELEHFERQVEAWFDGSMERLGGRFKRKSFGFTFVFSLVTVGGLNVDSIALANYFYSNEDARTAYAAKAYAEIDNDALEAFVDTIKSKQKKAKLRLEAGAGTATDSANANALLNDSVVFDSLLVHIKREGKSIQGLVNGLKADLPLGWKAHECENIKGLKWVRKIGGLLITVFAVCLGAPFWFEMLGKIANLRSSIKPDDKKKVEPKA